jgi:hypothetical protein
MAPRYSYLQVGVLAHQQDLRRSNSLFQLTNSLVDPELEHCYQRFSALIQPDNPHP